MNQILDIELTGIQQEMSLDILLNESNRFDILLNESNRFNNREIILEGNIINSIVNFFKRIIDAIKKIFKFIKDKLNDFFKKIRKKITGVNCNNEKGFKEAIDKYVNKFIKNPDTDRFCIIYLPSAEENLIKVYDDTLDTFDKILETFKNLYQGKDSKYSFHDCRCNIENIKINSIIKSAIENDIEDLNAEQLKLIVPNILKFINNYDKIIKDISNEENNLINEFKDVQKNMLKSIKESVNKDTTQDQFDKTMNEHLSFFITFTKKISELCSEYSKGYTKIYNSYIGLIDCLEMQRPNYKDNKINTTDNNFSIKIDIYKSIK